VPEAADQRRDLRPPARRCPQRRSGHREGPGRATGQRLCLQRGRLPPRAPALRTSHSRASTQPTTPRRPPTASGAAQETSQSPLTTKTTKRIRSAWTSARAPVGARLSIFGHSARQGVPAGAPRVPDLGGRVQDHEPQLLPWPGRPGCRRSRRRAAAQSRRGTCSSCRNRGTRCRRATITSRAASIRKRPAASSEGCH
jgi:hypothetical protein